MTNRRLLLVHAHPDDESITTGGTIAHYLAEGVEVTVVTCTMGEAGEVMDASQALLVTAESDQLGGYRVGELTAALAALGPGLRPRFLGGMGHWRDSGMAGTESAAHPRAFAKAVADSAADRSGPVAALVAVIREIRPQVVVSYDTIGGYGHPDHIAAHRITAAALASAADPRFRVDGAGAAVAAASAAEAPAWRVAKNYWTVTADSQVRDAVAAFARAELPASWQLPHPDIVPSHPDADITTVIDVTDVLERKVAAMRAHATQLAVSDAGTEFVLTNRITQPVLATEAFILVGGAPGGPGGAVETDLFAGLA